MAGWVNPIMLRGHTVHVGEYLAEFAADKYTLKRSLERSEWTPGLPCSPFHPRNGKQHILNEGAALYFVGQNTNLPVPRVHACFVENDVAYLIIERIPGTRLSRCDERHWDVVDEQMKVYHDALHHMKSADWGGPMGVVGCLLPLAWGALH